MAIATGTAILAAAAVTAAGSIYSSSQAAEAQSEALENAAQTTANWQNYLIALEERKYKDAARFRDLAYQEAQTLVGALQTMMPQAISAIGQEPQTAQEYWNLASERGAESIMSNFSAYGLSGSTVGKALGTMQEGLSAAQAQDLIAQKQFQINSMLGLMGRPTGISPTIGYGDYMGGAGIAAQNLAELGVAGGAVQAGLYGSIGQTAAQIPAYYQMYKGLGWGGSGGGGGGDYYSAPQSDYMNWAGKLGG